MQTNSGKIKRRLLGVHIAGGEASELNLRRGGNVAKNMTVEEIRNTAFPHPTVSEAIREAVFQIRSNCDV